MWGPCELRGRVHGEPPSEDDQTRRPLTSHGAPKEADMRNRHEGLTRWNERRLHGWANVQRAPLGSRRNAGAAYSASANASCVLAGWNYSSSSTPARLSASCCSPWLASDRSSLPAAAAALLFASPTLFLTDCFPPCLPTYLPACLPACCAVGTQGPSLDELFPSSSAVPCLLLQDSSHSTHVPPPPLRPAAHTHT